MGQKFKGSNLVGAEKSLKESPKESSRKKNFFHLPNLFSSERSRDRSIVRRRKTEEKKGAAINLVVRGDGTQPKKINKNKKDATARDKSWAGHETRSVEGQPIDSHKELGK